MTDAAVQRPILVTGAHRSGTTWVGAMLALSPRVGLIHEPFNPLTGPGVRNVSFDRFFRYVCDDNEAPYVEPFRQMLAFGYHPAAQLRVLRSPADAVRAARDYAGFVQARRRRARPLLKDPIAVFSAEWLARRFDAEVVCVVRHPAAFASSLLRLGWTHPFRTTLEQPLLLRDLLGSFEPEIRAFAEREQDPLDQAILLWRMIYATVAGYRERHPDWQLVRHEDLSRDPVDGFSALYAALGLPFDEGLREQVERHSGGQNPAEQTHRHAVTLDSRAGVESYKRRLTAEQIARIRTGTRDVWPAFYSDEDW